MVVFVDCSWSLLTSLGTGCHKWLNCLFVLVLNWVAVLHQVLCFHNHMTKIIIWGPFYGFNGKRLFRMNLIYGNTDNISHVPILTWPGTTSSFTSHHSTFSLKLRRWKVLRANQFYRNLPFISINVSFRETVSLKTFPWIFSHSNFIKYTLIFDVSNCVNVRFVHRVL